MCPQTFAQWHSSKGSAKQKEAEAAAQDRKRRGVMTGREIFQQVRKGPCRVEVRVVIASVSGSVAAS